MMRPVSTEKQLAVSLQNLLTPAVRLSRQHSQVSSKQKKYVETQDRPNKINMLRIRNPRNNPRKPGLNPTKPNLNPVNPSSRPHSCPLWTLPIPAVIQSQAPPLLGWIMNS